MPKNRVSPLVTNCCFLYKMGQKSRKNQNIQKMVDRSLELTLCMVWAKFDMICIIFPRSLGILVIFGKSQFCPKNIKFDKTAKCSPRFYLESEIFFFWSLNIIGILDFSKFGHLKSNISGFMAQKRPKNGHFGPKMGQIPNICGAITRERVGIFEFCKKHWIRGKKYF